MRRVRDGEAVSGEIAQRDFHSSFWIAVSGQHYNLSLLYTPGEWGERRGIY